MIFIEEFLLGFKPWVNISVALEHRLVYALGETLEEAAQPLLCVLAPHTQLEGREEEGGDGGEERGEGDVTKSHAATSAKLSQRTSPSNSRKTW